MKTVYYPDLTHYERIRRMIPQHYIKECMEYTGILFVLKFNFAAPQVTRQQIHGTSFINTKKECEERHRDTVRSQI